MGCLKKQIGLEVFNMYLNSKSLISYSDSKFVTRSSKFVIGIMCIQIYSIKTNKIIATVNIIAKSKEGLVVIPSFRPISLKISQELPRTLKKSQGIFFTSSLLVNQIFLLLKSFLFLSNSKILNVLEPSCGSGEFLFGLNSHFCNLNIIGIEHNTVIYNSIKNLYNTNANLNKFTLKNQDFLVYFEPNRFDLIIGNPPYKSVKKSCVLLYKEIFLNKVNMYVLFILHSLEQLKDDGFLVYILPKTFLTCISYINVRLIIKNYYTILSILDVEEKNSFLGTNVETCVIFLQKRKSRSSQFYVFFGPYFSFSNKFVFLNEILNRSKSLKSLGFTVTLGSVLKSKVKTFSGNSKGYFITSEHILNNQLVLEESSTVCSKSLLKGKCVIVFRGYGNAKYCFKYALVDINAGYLLENHLFCIRQTGSMGYLELLTKLKNEKTLSFINEYFSNQSISKKEVELLPIY